VAARSGVQAPEIGDQSASLRTRARIRIETSSPETTDAVHAFLLFQNVDHNTGLAEWRYSEFRFPQGLHSKNSFEIDS